MFAALLAAALAVKVATAQGGAASQPCTTALPNPAVGGLSCLVGYTYPPGTAGVPAPSLASNTSWLYCGAYSANVNNASNPLIVRAYGGFDFFSVPTLGAIAAGRIDSLQPMVLLQKQKPRSSLW